MMESIYMKMYPVTGIFYGYYSELCKCIEHNAFPFDQIIRDSFSASQYPKMVAYSKEYLKTAVFYNGAAAIIDLDKYLKYYDAIIHDRLKICVNAEYLMFSAYSNVRDVIISYTTETEDSIRAKHYQRMAASLIGRHDKLRYRDTLTCQPRYLRRCGHIQTRCEGVPGQLIW